MIMESGRGMENTYVNLLKELQEKYQAKWGGLNPRKGRDTLL